MDMGRLYWGNGEQEITHVLLNFAMNLKLLFTKVLIKKKKIPSLHFVKLMQAHVFLLGIEKT